MKIAVFSRNYRCFLFIIFIISFFICLKFLTLQFFAVQKYVCAVDCHISSSCQQLIEKKITEITREHSDPRKIISFLKEEFPFIEKIHILFRPFICVITLQTYRPLCVINNELVLNGNSVLCKKSVYQSLAVDLLPHIKVKNDLMQESCMILSYFINSLPNNFHLLYDLTFFSKNNIVLADKFNKNFFIICTADQEISTSVFDNCELIKKQLSDRNMSNKYRNNMWIIDIRFANQIIVSKETGG